MRSKLSGVSSQSRANWAMVPLSPSRCRLSRRSSLHVFVIVSSHRFVTVIPYRRQKDREMTRRTITALGVPCMLAAFLSMAWAADPKHAPDGAGSAEMQRLKAQLDEQQKQIEELRAALAAQMKMLEKVTATANAAS